MGEILLEGGSLGRGDIFYRDISVVRRIGFWFRLFVCLLIYFWGGLSFCLVLVISGLGRFLGGVVFYISGFRY